MDCVRTSHSQSRISTSEDHIQLPIYSPIVSLHIHAARATCGLTTEQDRNSYLNGHDPCKLYEAIDEVIWYKIYKMMTSRTTRSHSFQTSEGHDMKLRAVPLKVTN